MSNAFSRTLRALDRSSMERSHVPAFAAIVVLAAWTAWLLLAKLSVYETSEAARLEVTRATHAFDAPIAGRVVKTSFALDTDVTEGDILVELDAEPQRLALGEANAKAASITSRLAATRAELDAEKQALAHFRHQGKATIDEATSRVEEARIASAHARDEYERIDRLQKNGAIPEIDAVRSKADAQGKSAAEAALRAQQSKLEREWITGQSDRGTQIAAHRLDVVRLEGELAQLTAQIESLQHQIERRHVRAPASGRIGEISHVGPGSYVEEGDRMGTIVAKGDLRAVAEFKPASAFGRIRTGQPARIRFDGFPWTEYGETQAQVAGVAAEVRDGRARVELTITTVNDRIPVQHGLPGNVEVEVERTTPARLILRAAGQLVHRPGAPLSEPPPSRAPLPRITRQ
ncbi:HlyD family secretion protein [Pendulispora albinea]|uniref:HlyD family efflux transporter periplasmic adaptor subunit n=1 Tax=Pendulispora albinea TaxID=2741071 RepID=A0ABZ2M1Y7_9BACT